MELHLRSGNVRIFTSRPQLHLDVLVFYEPKHSDCCPPNLLEFTQVVRQSNPKQPFYFGCPNPSLAITLGLIASVLREPQNYDVALADIFMAIDGVSLHMPTLESFTQLEEIPLGFAQAVTNFNVTAKK